MTGAVRFPFAKSLPAGFPSCSADWVKSRISSTTWNESPRFLPYSYICSHIVVLTPLNIAADLVLEASNEAVL
ncbi:Os05g0582350 [Oryza sativa Japonica Group]|uniref:Os05g0582350 protein n=1 Tax=Oryza sativa subsp. japonica TaxID=39947 RepID=A0A0P0WRE4_ORYSJ|nr:hypothetical protein EE612_031366 [Oryza sativa]BAS95535.1 Os05g0582350 [Oryza sativa Japonica Group]